MYVLHIRSVYPSAAHETGAETAVPLPQSWYERTWLHAGAGILSGLALQALFWQLWGYVPPLWLAVVAAVCYLAGLLFDMGATHFHIRQKRDFDARGLLMPTREANPLLPAYPTLAQQIWNTATLLSLLYVVLAAAMPGVGLGAALLHGLAGMRNWRAYKRCVLVLRAFDAECVGNGS